MVAGFLRLVSASSAPHLRLLHFDFLPPFGLTFVVTPDSGPLLIVLLEHFAVLVEQLDHDLDVLEVGLEYLFAAHLTEVELESL